MSIQLNHTIVSTRDPQASAKLLAAILNRAALVRFGPFRGVELDNGVTLDFMEKEGDIVRQHYAFLVSEQESDAVFGRIRERRLAYWADPGHRHPARSITATGGAAFTGATRMVTILRF